MLLLFHICLQCFDTVGWTAGRASDMLKMGRWWRWALLSPDGVAPSPMVSVFASINLTLYHKVQKFTSGTGSPGWSRKKGHKTVVCVCYSTFVHTCSVLWCVQFCPSSVVCGLRGGQRPQRLAGFQRCKWWLFTDAPVFFGSTDNSWYVLFMKNWTPS